MKNKLAAGLFIAVMLLSAASVAQARPDLTQASNPVAGKGEWLWAHLDEPVLSFGTMSIAADDGTTLFAGGSGYVAVSNDSGATWQETLRFRNARNTTPFDIFSDDEGNEPKSKLSNEQIVETLRKYLQTELEEELDTETVEDLLEEITDEELLDADSIEDIEVLKELELEMDPDLTHVLNESSSVAGLNLPDSASYIERYRLLINNGAEEQTAKYEAAASSAVWDIVPTQGATYAVTSDTIYLSSDAGYSWSSFLQLSGNGSILSLDVSPDSQTIAIGTTDGVIMTRDAGENWLRFSDIIEGAVFQVDVRYDNYWILTTHHLYRSSDRGFTWNIVELPLGGNEQVLRIVPAKDGMMSVTNEHLYYSADGSRWEMVSHAPFEDEIIRQVIPVDETLSSFIVRTDAHVFQYDASGWTALNDMLFTDELGELMLFSSGYTKAVMATPDGVWFAQSFAELIVSDEYKQLFDTWAREPSDYDVILKALEAHYLDDFADSRWGMRSRLAWLLPTVTFDYYHRQKNTDKSLITATLNGLQAASYTEKMTFTREKQSYWQIMAKWNVEIERGLRHESSGISSEISNKTKRASLISQVKKLINKRRSSQTTLILDIPKFPEKRLATKKKIVKATLSMQEAEAMLHYMTDGYYIPAVYPDKK